MYSSISVCHNEKATEVNSLKFLQIQLFTAVSYVSCNLRKFCSITQDLHGYIDSNVNIQKHTLSFPVFASNRIPWFWNVEMLINGYCAVFC